MGQNGPHVAGLADAHLKQQGSAQPQGGPPPGGDGPVKVQSVGPAVQGGAGLVVPHAHVQPRDVPGGDIGRVAGDHVEIPQGRVGRLQGVGLNAGHPGVELVAADILLAQPEGRLAHIGQHHPAAGHISRHRQTHAAAPGAQIQHPRPLSGGPGQQDGPLGQHLGIHPGDQHVGGDVQAQAIELPLPDEVGHRLPGQPPLQQLRQLLLHRVGGIKGHIPVKLLPALAGRTADQLPRLQLGALHAGLSQPLAGIQVEVVVRGRHTETTPLSLSNFLSPGEYQAVIPPFSSWDNYASPHVGSAVWAAQRFYFCWCLIPPVPFTTDPSPSPPAAPV